MARRATSNGDEFTEWRRRRQWQTVTDLGLYLVARRCAPVPGRGPDSECHSGGGRSLSGIKVDPVCTKTLTPVTRAGVTVEAPLWPASG